MRWVSGASGGYRGRAQAVTETGGFMDEQASRKLRRDPGPVTALAVGGDGSAMLEAGHSLQREVHDLAARFARHAGYETRPAAVALKSRVVEPDPLLVLVSFRETQFVLWWEVGGAARQGWAARGAG